MLVDTHLFYVPLLSQGETKRWREGQHRENAPGCGGLWPQTGETLTMLKSAVLFSTKPLHFHIFAEDHLHYSFKDSVSLSRRVSDQLQMWD